MAEADPFKQSKATIEGDLDVAVTAQVNRWAKRLGIPAFPLVAATLTPATAGYAVSLLKQRMQLALVMTADPLLLAEIADLSQATTNPYEYVRTHREFVVRTLAQYGDSLGLPPAVAGITIKEWRREDWLAAGALAALGGAAAFFGARALRKRL